jgi:peptide/nickel transport system substrate-binding protein
MFRIAITLTLTIAGLSGCARAPAPCDAAAAPSTVRIAVANPMAPQVANRDLVGRLFSGATLLGSDHLGQPRPALASKWETSDRRTWTLTLRDGLHTHDGQPLTSTAIRDALLPRVPQLKAYSPVWRDVTGIDAPTPATLVFRLARPSSAFPEALSEYSVVGESGMASLDAGPFRLTGEEGDHTDHYASFPGFWNGPPKMAGLRVSFFTSQRAAWAAFLRGEADVLYQVSPEFIPLLAQNPDVQLFDSGVRRLSVLGFQQRHPILRDARVRQALNLAIDRDEIARRFMGRGVDAERGPFSPAYWAVQDAGPSWPHDPTTARAILASVTANGRTPLELECLTTNEFTTVSDIAAALEAQLSRVHVRLKLRALPSQELYRRLAAGEYDVFVMPMLAGTTGLWPYTFWHSRSQRYLRSGYTAADAALDAWYTAASPDAEREAARAVLDVMRRDPPAAFLGPTPSVRAVRRTWRIPEDEVNLRESLPRWTPAPSAGCGAGAGSGAS